MVNSGGGEAHFKERVTGGGHPTLLFFEVFALLKSRFSIFFSSSQGPNFLFLFVLGHNFLHWFAPGPSNYCP